MILRVLPSDMSKHRRIDIKHYLNVALCEIHDETIFVHTPANPFLISSPREMKLKFEIEMQISKLRSFRGHAVNACLTISSPCLHFQLFSE